MAKYRRFNESQKKKIIIALVLALGIGYTAWDKMSHASKRKISRMFNTDKIFESEPAKKQSHNSKRKSGKKSRTVRGKSQGQKSRHISKNNRKKSGQKVSKGRTKRNQNIHRASDR